MASIVVLCVTAIVLIMGCEDEPQDTVTPVPSPTPIAHPTPLPTATPGPMPTRQPAATPTWIPLPFPTRPPAPARTSIIEPTSTPAPERGFNVQADIKGYWTDGGATIEIALAPWNMAEPQSIFDVQVTVVCQAAEMSGNDCGLKLNISFPYSEQGRLGTLVTRLPQGNTTLLLEYGEGESQEVHATIPDLILGVDRDVWECFSDRSNVHTYRHEDEGIGCAGWSDETIHKWDRESPMRMFVDAPDEFSAAYRSVVNALSSIVNLKFDWVAQESDADITAYIGLTREEARALLFFCDKDEEYGCSRTVVDAVTGEIEGGRIAILNQWTNLGDDLGDFHNVRQGTFEAAMLQEVVQTLTNMAHRTELRSSMKEELQGTAELNPMDEALLRLHGHNLVRPGMTIDDIGSLVVFRDELMDPQPPDSRWAAWKHVTNSHRQLREATTATYRVRTTSPSCSLEPEWWDYEVSNLTSNHPYFAWTHVNTGENELYSLEPDPGSAELWRRWQTGWDITSDRDYSDAAPGWRRELADPHHMLESLLHFADFEETRISYEPGSPVTLAFELQNVRGATLSSVENVEITLVIDIETYVLLEYTLDWEIADASCATYRVEAIEGRYGPAFTFPESIRDASQFLDNCQIVSLGSLRGYMRKLGHWARECGPASITQGYARSYAFSVDDWAFVRFELLSDDDMQLHMLGGGNSDPTVLEPQHSGYLDGNLRVGKTGKLLWSHFILAAGDYVIEVANKDRALPGSFSLTTHAQPTPPPPYRFKSVSAGGSRTCGLLTDGTPPCWGERGVDGPGTAAPPGKFMAISTHGYTCALREDGTPVCWDFYGDEIHTCGPTDPNIYCKLDKIDEKDRSGQDWDAERDRFYVVAVNRSIRNITPPPGEKLVSISTGEAQSCGLREDGTAVCWGGMLEGEAPPANERFLSIQTGGRHICGLRTDGTAVCWGSDYKDLLAVPQDVRFAAISVGDEYSCGFLDDGSAMCWGSSGLETCSERIEGSFGCSVAGTNDYVSGAPPETELLVSVSTGSPNCALTPERRPVCWSNYRTGLAPAPANEQFMSISASRRHACAVRFDGALACWGYDSVGQASPPSGDNLNGRSSGDEAPTDLATINSGGYFTCALNAQGIVSCWGSNWWRGRFAGPFVSINGGWAHACGLRPDGSVICRGSNSDGQASPPSDERFISISSGYFHSCGLRLDGTVECWGEEAVALASPRVGALVSISSGASHVCGLRSDGEVRCWGDDDIGQLSYPLGVVFSTVSSGGFHTCALTMDGAPVCWGLDREGQSSPPQDEKFTSLSSGGHHTCALRADGTPICWGWDVYGQSTPPTAERFVAISSGSIHTCGLRTDGTASCWGEDNQGQASPQR